MGTNRYPSSNFDGFFYSFGTCGVSQSQSLEWEKLVTARTLRNRTLRYAYPADSRPWHFRVWNPVAEQWEWDGMMHKYFLRIANLAGFHVEERNLSDYSVATFASKWDACTHDVLMGLIDICPTAGQQTANRMQMSAFTAALIPSHLVLMVKRSPHRLSWNPLDGYSSAWLAFARPFSEWLWLVCMGVTFAVGIALGILEGPRVAVGFDGREDESLEKKHAPPETPIRNWISAKVSGIPPSIYLASYGMFTHDVPHRCASNSAKAVKLGYAFWVLIVVSSYTANLAHLLMVVKLEHRGIKSISDCYITSRTSSSLCMKVCVEQHYRQALQENHPSVELEVFASSTAVKNGLKEGVCEAALVPEHDAKARLDYQQDMIDSEWILVGEPLLSINVASPIHMQLANAYSYNAVLLNFQGVFDAYHAQYKANIFDISVNDADALSDQLQLEHLLGPLVITGILVAVSVLFWRGASDARQVSETMARPLGHFGRTTGSLARSASCASIIIGEDIARNTENVARSAGSRCKLIGSTFDQLVQQRTKGQLAPPPPATPPTLATPVGHFAHEDSTIINDDDMKRRRRRVSI